VSRDSHKLGGMNTNKAKKSKIILIGALALLALPATLSAVTSMARAQSPTELQASSAIEQVFQSDWGTADADVYARIAIAFNAQAMEGADLKRVECRSSLCKVVFQAEENIKVQRILPRQLAESFNAMVSVHAGEESDLGTLIYLDIPPSA
jgi:hypothetical protein